MISVENFKSLCQIVAANPVVLALVLVIPWLVLTFQANTNHNFWILSMLLESLGLSFSWGSSSASSSSSSLQERRNLRKKHIRTRADQPAANGSAKHDSGKDGNVEASYYPGLVNISGTYCFMNSTLQAMASLCYLQPHIDRIHAKAEVLDVPTPVIDALRELLQVLNAPRSYPSSLRPLDIINALSSHSQGKQNALFSSREHQDAQELFQLLSECIKKEAIEVDREGHRDRGLGGLSHVPADLGRDIGQSVFDGLTANRRSCVECGYTEAVMHFAFDNWQLALPRYPSCRLEDCLADYTRLEVLTDCICRKCSMLATHRRLVQEAERLTEAASKDENPTSSRKKRAREARKLESRVKAALDHGKIEEDIKGVKMEKVVSRASTKQAMIARPPPVLALHLNRSMHYGHYATKNNCRVFFSEILDLTPYTTSGNLSTAPSAPISSPPPQTPRSTTPTPATYATPRTLYRLSGVICHYGQHSFGHYVCFRRKPRPPSARAYRYTPPKQACPLGCECEKCQRYGPIRDDDYPPVPGRGWLRISDDSVHECGVETVLAEGSGAFMLFYERVLHPRPNIYPSRSPRSSQETVRPDIIHPNGSCVMLQSSGDSKPLVADSQMAEKSLGPRIVRNVAAGRGKSSYPVSLERELSVVTSENDLSLKAEAPPTGNGSTKVSLAPSKAARTKFAVSVGPGVSLPGSERISTSMSSDSGRQPDSKAVPASSLALPPPSPVSPSSHPSQTRLKAPQPVRPTSGESSISPARTIGLRA